MSDTKPVNGPFLEGNEIIEQAIAAWHTQDTKENLFAVLETIRSRMHQDGHFVVPVIASEDGTQFTFRTLQTKDGKNWLVAFTSGEEQEKGPASQVLSHFIDSMLKACIDGEKIGLMLNPFGQPFMLTPDMIEMIFEADGGVEYIVPDDAVTPELLEDGSFLKRTIEICSRNRTQMNTLRLLKILRDSLVWIPCNAVLSEADYAALEKLVKEAQENGGEDTLVGRTISNSENIRMVPDILQSGDDFFFPVFTSAEEMGEYGQNFSKVQKHFLEAVSLARNNEKNVTRIVINAFSDPFVVPRTLFDLIEGLPSNFRTEEETENE